MEYKKLILFLATCISIVFLAVFTTPVSALSESNRNTFSFRFENCTVTDALKEISKKSGINIIITSTFKKEILRKSFVNRSLDSILADLLRGENCAVVWNYSGGNLHSIDLFTPDEGSLKRTGTRAAAIRSTGRDNTQSTFQGNTRNEGINETGNNYSRNRESNRLNRSNTTVPIPRTTLNKDLPSLRVPVNKNYTTGINRKKTAVSGSSRAYANMRRATANNNQNTGTDEVKETINPQPSPTSSESSEISESPELPETPEPEKGNGLEPPPMPPGL
jgi:hypothetical protein